MAGAIEESINIDGNCTVWLDLGHRGAISAVHVEA